MTDKQTEALKLALEALEMMGTPSFLVFLPDEIKTWQNANEALREALAEQPASKQRHISYVCPQCHWSLDKQPEQQQWVGLTDEEVIIMSRYDLEYAALIGEVQRKLKEKNT